MLFATFLNGVACVTSCALILLLFLLIINYRTSNVPYLHIRYRDLYIFLAVVLLFFLFFLFNEAWYLYFGNKTPDTRLMRLFDTSFIGVLVIGALLFFSVFIREKVITRYVSAAVLLIFYTVFAVIEASALRVILLDVLYTMLIIEVFSAASRVYGGELQKLFRRIGGMLIAYFPLFLFEEHKIFFFDTHFTYPKHPWFAPFFLFWAVCFILFIRRFLVIKPIFEPNEVSYEAWFDNCALTRREREIVLLIAQGAMNKEISGELNIALPTVKYHVTKILQKTDCKSRTQLVRRMSSYLNLYSDRSEDPH